MKRTVLVVEDNEQNLYLVSFMLQSCGYTVLQARDGLEGTRPCCLLHRVHRKAYQSGNICGGGRAPFAERAVS